jgi:enoyl-CoA hydratase/carnithine racemase
LQWGVATHFVDQTKLSELYSSLEKNVNAKTTLKDVEQIVNSVADNSVRSKAIVNMKEIDYCFQPDSAKNILHRLEEVSQGKVEGMDKDFAAKTLQTMSKHSPLSMSVVFEQIIRGSKMTLQDVFRMEYKIS